MKVVVDRGALVKILATLRPVRGSGQQGDKLARLWACAGRVFVEADDVTAGVEALVLRDGSCYVPRVQFLKLVQSFTPKASVTIEADARTLRIESVTMASVDFSPVGVPPAKFDVFAVSDASWMTESALKTYGLKDAPPVPPSKSPVVPPKPSPPAPSPLPPPVPPVPKHVGPVIVSQWTETPDAGGLLWIGFACPECGKQFQAKDGKQGKVMRCPQCGTELVIPGEKKAAPVPTVPVTVPTPPPVPTVPVIVDLPGAKDPVAALERKIEQAAAGIGANDIHFDCAKCGQSLVVEARAAGLAVPCPKCGQQVTIPGADTNSAGGDKETDVPSVAATERSNGMNMLQKRILSVGLALFALAGLFPSWVAILQVPSTGHKVIQAAGRGFLLSPPPSPQFSSNSDYRKWVVVRVDFQRLLVEWVLVLVVTAGGMVLAQRRGAALKE